MNLLERTLDAAHDCVTFFAALAVVAFVAFYMSHHQEERYPPPGELVRTPDDGFISYTGPSLDAPSGGPWCYVVQKIAVPNKGPEDGAMSMIYARTCEELPLRWMRDGAWEK